MEDYERLIQVARQRLEVARETPERDLGGGEVQLSVRLPVGLRTAIAGAASRRNQSVTAFVTDTLLAAVSVDADPFAALAADMTAHARALLAEAVRSGDYATAAAAVDAGEQDG